MPTSVELVERALAAIDQHGARTNAFIRVERDSALAQAKRLDDETRRGTNRGPLHGMPISLKDLIDVQGQPTTAGSSARASHVAQHDAPIVTRLRDAGAVILGKTNLHEFALGPTNDESAFGAVRNPYDESRVAGGSSGGAAAAVAAGMGIAAIGSDTGGSIRIPAAACGVVGLKPSLGEVPTDGVVPLSFTLDHVGPLARTVADAAAVWSVLAAKPLPPLDSSASPIRLGLLGDYFTEFLSDEVSSAFEASLDTLRRAGAVIVPAKIPNTEKIVETYTNISLPEAAEWHRELLATNAADYQPIVRDRLRRGAQIPAVDYIRAMAMREVFTRAVEASLENHDALVLPTLPIVAPAIGVAEVAFSNGRTLAARAALLRLTQLFNITGHPAMTIPIRAPELPVGLQLVGKRGRTADLLGVAAWAEGRLNTEADR
jgi:aspartyl-tRNA(Asn)/glutamyl-tRNA(Gln) amidotransferase subunit A